MFRERLRDVFLHQFEKAAEARDSNMVTRFFKLFPPIGWEAEGLEVYSTFVVSLVQPRTSFADTCTLQERALFLIVFNLICSILASLLRDGFDCSI